MNILGCFYLLAIVNNVVANVPVLFSSETLLPTNLCKHPETELLDWLCGNSIFNFGKIIRLFSIVATPFYILTERIQSPNSSISLTSFDTFLDNGSPGVQEMVFSLSYQCL